MTQIFILARNSQGGVTGFDRPVQGRIHGVTKAAAHQYTKLELLSFVLDSFTRLKREADLVLVEGTVSLCGFSSTGFMCTVGGGCPRL